MIINLMYHDVFVHNTNESGFQRERDLPYKMNASMFERHVKSISDYCESTHQSKNHVVFTFDDGGKSFYQVIAPILEKYGLKGIFFITTKYIGTDTFLDEEEIRDLHKRGHIIGSHAHTHKHLYTLTDEQVEDEWKCSTEILSCILGEPIKYASIPNGDTSKRVLANAYKYGIRYIYTSEPITKVSYFNDMQVIGRYVLLSDNSTEYVMSIINSSKKRFLLLCKRAALKIIKAVLGGYYLKIKNLLFR